MKMIEVSHVSDRLVEKMLSWCHHSFGEGGLDKDWLVDDEKIIFWDESFYAMFLLRWTGQTE
jgi:hypothetical protein